jgi:hypothetical protein
MTDIEQRTEEAQAMAEGRRGGRGDPGGDTHPLSIAETQARLEAAAAEPPGRKSRSAERRSEATVPTDLSAERIELTQGGIARADAAQIAVHQGGVGRAEAEEISVRQGGIGVARGDRIRVDMGAVGAALGTDVHVRRAFSRLAAARNAVTLEQAGAMTVVANRVEMRPRSGAIFVFARRVEGEVRPIFDWRSGAAFGAVAGLIVAAAQLLRGRRR